VSRGRAAAAAAGLLLALLLIGQPWAELPRRVESVRSFAARELAVRRLGGSGTAFDRPYFVFLENARRRLPKSAGGVAIYGAPPGDPYVYLAHYQFAPHPIAFAPATVPDGWVAAIYGAGRLPGARVLAEWAGGTLVEPAP
jgi:hypothetical protein